MFTFVVTCYNQAEVIGEALESIRYQIKRYGGREIFQLVAADDGSTDGSKEAIEAWLAENGSLFVRTDKVFRSKNAGICRNYVDALQKVEGERFMVLNGDDLLSPVNVFTFSDRLDQYEIVCTGFLKFTGEGEINRQYGAYLELALQRFIQGDLLRLCIRLGCPIMGTAVYRKELLTKEVYDFILSFRTVNDRACFQKIVALNPGIKTCYINKPIILYRISNNSVSNFNSPGRRLHNAEIGRLCRVERKKEKSLLVKALLLWQEKSAALRAHPNYYVRLLRFFSPYYAIMLFLTLRHFGEIGRMERGLVDKNWKVCREHYNAVRKNRFLAGDSNFCLVGKDKK